MTYCHLVNTYYSISFCAVRHLGQFVELRLSNAYTSMLVSTKLRTFSPVIEIRGSISGHPRRQDPSRTTSQPRHVQHDRQIPHILLLLHSRNVPAASESEYRLRM